ncbi:MAG: WD40/YVTN/BNR-like repeat-containing protein [Candidatus Hermodarchaeota archaeon]
MNEFWLLTVEGILDNKGTPIQNVPFQNRLVLHGDFRNDQTAVIVDRKEIWTFIDGVWSKKATSNINLNCLLWTHDNRLLVGTAEARLAWVKDDELEFIKSFDAVEERRLWNTPWGGPPDVRSLALGTDGILYANIHVGWIVRSTDGGKTWESVHKDLEKDVHHVSAHPTKPNIVFAATAYGFHISTNQGNNFTRRWKDIPLNYQRTTICFPDKDVYLASVSRGPRGQQAALYRSENQGETWDKVQGLPDSIQLNLNTHQLTVFEGGRAMIMVENTELYETEDYGETWTSTNQMLPKTYQILIR